MTFQLPDELREAMLSSVREGDEKGPWHAPWCLMHRKEFPTC